MKDTNVEFSNPESQASQCAKILAYLRQGNTITSLEALKRFKCMRLASRISEIKMRQMLTPGEILETKKIVTSTGKRVAQYKIVRRLTDNGEI